MSDPAGGMAKSMQARIHPVDQQAGQRPGYGVRAVGTPVVRRLLRGQAAEERLVGHGLILPLAAGEGGMREDPLRWAEQRRVWRMVMPVVLQASQLVEVLAPGMDEPDPAGLGRGGRVLCPVQAELWVIAVGTYVQWCEVMRLGLQRRIRPLYGLPVALGFVKEAGERVTTLSGQGDKVTR
jgi:hypothetical protein